jgi:hypothetical protein
MEMVLNTRNHNHWNIVNDWIYYLLSHDCCLPFIKTLNILNFSHPLYTLSYTYTYIYNLCYIVELTTFIFSWWASDCWLTCCKQFDSNVITQLWWNDDADDGDVSIVHDQHSELYFIVQIFKQKTIFQLYANEYLNLFLNQAITNLVCFASTDRFIQRTI